MIAHGLLIAEKELRELLRDRRALFFAFVLPLLLYPALFFATGRLEEARRETAQGRPSRIGVAGQAGRLLDLLEADPEFDVTPAPADWGLLADGELDALVLVQPRPPGAAVEVRLYFEGSTPASREARRRLDRALEEYRAELLTSRFAQRGAAIDPNRDVSVVFRDLANPAERAGAVLGRLLPFLLVALLLTGGAFAAIDLIAGEKERGTLETLFVQPVAAGSVVLGKFLAVLAASLAAVVLNFLGMAGALAVGLGPAGGPPGGFTLPPAGSLATTFVLLIPLAVLTSSILLALSTHARSFREAQIFLLPVTLVGMLPAALAALPDIRLSPAVAVVPVANTALAIRDALDGEYHWPYLGLAFASTALYAGLALRWAAQLLAREELRLGLEEEPLLAAAGGVARARRGTVMGALMLLLMAYGGSALQRPDGALGVYGGLAVTLWGLVLVPSLLYVWTFRLPPRDALALRAPRSRDVLAALLLVPLAVALVLAYLAFQDAVLPFPEGFRKTLERIFAAESLGPGLAILLLAVSPAVCEEVLWRGVVQGELESEGRPVKTILMIGLFFGLFHLDAYRLAPTAALGCLLAYLRLTTRSLVPCAIFHGLYNGAMLMLAKAGQVDLTAWATRPGVGLAALVVLAALGRWMWLGRRRETPEAGPAPPPGRTR